LQAGILDVDRQGKQAPVALKHAGVSAIIAKSFARIFYRMQ